MIYNFDNLKGNPFINDNVFDNVSVTLGKNDTMLSDSSRIHHYFEVGADALSVINKILQYLNIPKEQIGSILDFPCGKGRVLRFIKAQWPDAEIYGSDIAERFTVFCKKEFNVKTFVSNKEFKDFELSKEFDLIWVGSLITHLPENLGLKLMTFLSKKLSKGGVLIISNHWLNSFLLYKNRFSDDEKLSIMGALDTNKYSFTPYKNTPDYGMSFISPEWYIKNISKWDFKFMNYTEGLWDNNQDIICLKKK